MDKFFGSVDTRNGIHFPVLPTTYCDELSYLEVVSKLIDLVNELIEQCNLNTKDKNKLLSEWNELITSTVDGKKLYEQLKEFIEQHKGLLDIDSKLSHKIYYSRTLDEIKNIALIRIGDVVYCVDEEAYYIITGTKDELSYEITNTLYAKLQYNLYITPQQLGYKEGDCTNYLNTILKYANIKLVSNIDVNGVVTIPSNKVFKGNHYKVNFGESGCIKIGSIPATSYVQKVFIDDVVITTKPTNNIKSIIDCKQAIFLSFNNIYVPSVGNDTTVLSLENCFNVSIDGFNLGYYGGGTINCNTTGIKMYETKDNIIAGTNNNTNTEIKNSLIQCIKTGIELECTNGLFDTLLFENIGFSYNNTCINIVGGNSDNCNINIKTMRAEFSGTAINNSVRLNVDGLQVYNTTTGITNSGTLFVKDYIVRGSEKSCVLNNTGQCYFLTHVRSANSNTIVPGILNRSYHCDIYECTPSEIRSKITKFNNITLVLNQNFSINDLPTGDEYEGIHVKIICNTGLTITGGLYGNSYEFGDYQIAELFYRNKKWYVFGGHNVKEQPTT